MQVGGARTIGSWCPGGMAVDCRCCRVLLPQLSPVVVDDICRVDGVVRISAHPRARAARCVRCGRVSRRVHSSYRRRLADLPVAGQPTVLWLTVRRFFCDQDVCSSGTFVEQVAGLTERFAQRSIGLQDALVAVALALAGRAGSRSATLLGMPVSRSTLLRPGRQGRRGLRRLAPGTPRCPGHLPGPRRRLRRRRPSRRTAGCAGRRQVAHVGQPGGSPASSAAKRRIKSLWMARRTLRGQPTRLSPANISPARPRHAASARANSAAPPATPTPVTCRVRALA